MTETTTSDSDSLILTVTPDGLPDDDFQGESVVRFIGTDPTTGENIIFAVDHRPACALIEAVLAEGEVDALVETWQVIGKGAF